MFDIYPPWHLVVEITDMIPTGAGRHPPPFASQYRHTNAPEKITSLLYGFYMQGNHPCTYRDGKKKMGNRLRELAPASRCPERLTLISEFFRLSLLFRVRSTRTAAGGQSATLESENTSPTATGGREHIGRWKNATRVNHRLPICRELLWEEE